MTLKAIRALFNAGQIIKVTNHYITRPDHPCYGTRERTIARVSSSHLWLPESGSVPWPRASQVSVSGNTVILRGGGIGQDAQAPFLTIELS